MNKKIKLSSYCKGETYVFIDAANIFYSQRTLGWKIKFEKLYSFFSKHCTLGKIFFYYSQNNDSASQKKFFKVLEKIGYILRVKPLKIIKDKKETIIHKGNLDVELAIDVMKNIEKFETMVLMSGDSDFQAVVKETRDSGKMVIILSTRGHVSKEIIQSANKYFDLRKFKEEIAFK